MGGLRRGEPLPAAEVLADLRRDGWLGRFPDETEDEYRTWVAAQIIPLGVILLVISIPAWLLIPLITRIAHLELASTALWVQCWSHALLLVVIIALGRRFRPQAVTIGLVGAVVIATDHMYLFNSLVDTFGPPLVASTAVFWMFLGPFVRLPFRETVVYVAAVTGTAVAFLAHDVDTNRISGQDAFPFLVMMTVALALVLGAALVTEQVTRAKYVDERTIEHQQRLLIEAHRLVRRYAPPAVADLIDIGENTSVDAPQRRRVTVLFSDVVGFTDLADRLDPETLTQVVNEYLAALAQIIDRHQGTLNEFAGDGVMALFGAPVEMAPEKQVEAAVATAREIQATLPLLNQEWLRLGVDHDLTTRIGINTGVLSVGSFGSEGRATYTGIGLQTNIAARIQDRCDPGAILLSHASWQLVKDRIRCVPRGEVTVKGVHFPVAVFQVDETSLTDE